MPEPSPHAPDLRRIQQWMRTVITHPHGIAAGLASHEAHDSFVGPIDALVTPSATLSEAERLAIYSRSYHARLLECLRTTFPALYQALGPDLFNPFALDYLQRYPPSSYSLHHLADHFPRYLRETRPDAAAPPAAREAWPDFLIDLATLEQAYLQVYDGPGLEGRWVPGQQELPGLSADAWPHTRPVPAPCLRLFAFRYPVHTFLLAVRRQEQPALPAAEACFVAVTRQRFRVQLHTLSDVQHALLSKFDGHRTVAQALRQDAALTGLAEDTGPHAWLCQWAAWGFFQAVILEDVPSPQRRSPILPGEE